MKQEKARQPLEPFFWLRTVWRSRAEYEAFARDLGVGEEILEEIESILKNFDMKKKPFVEQGQADNLLENLTREYHRGTGS